MLAGALAVGAAIAHLRISPVMLMYWSQILNGFLLPPLLIVLLLLAGNPQVVRTYTNRLASKLVGWGTVLLTLWLVIEMTRQLVAGH
jgi:Mn2+/Fe2+ NRAMP family transporter